ncbi:MAG: tRNA pseudouridine(38-40) synthase TruA [Acidimicrobiia bacterium]|nr:MAG: tRNA pseudouridine(38-40) synthase TruA [Acidimicrobiia bacterium]
MPTYRLDLAYDGTGFSGYAIQPEQRTVQGELETALAHHTGPVATSVAGRTDRGVHAAGQVIGFSHDEEIDAGRVLRSLNSQLGEQIVILDLRRVDDGFHARFSATGRSYRYQVLNRRVHDPLQARTSWHVKDRLDVDAMNEASALLVGTHDFASFCRNTVGAMTVREVRWAAWRRRGDLVEFVIAANAFCHQMVRGLVVVLVDVGRRRLTPAEFEAVFAAEDRSTGGGAAPPQGLTLMAVGYPETPLAPPDWVGLVAPPG